MSDSDTEADLLPNNILAFQNEETTISAKGPNINSANISSLSFRNNVMTSTMNMPWYMDRPRYAESVSDQRSMYYNRERERSPMSLHSASGMHPRNIHHSYYPGALMGSHRSMYNGRSRSPTMSVRSIDSNTSVSAKDIAFALQNGNFNKFESKIIKDACNRYMKHQTRKRVEKRRNVRMFLKGLRRRSGGDSGDQASNSSISSDDCRSTRTSRSTIYKGNMSSCRSTKTDISDLRRTMRESNMYKDCSDNFRQNSFKSMFSGGQTIQKENWQNMQKWPNNSNMVNSVTQPQKERFRSGFQLPSQRFKQSITSLPIPEKSYRLQRINEGNMLDIRHNVPDAFVHRKNLETDSEQEEIFADVTVLEKSSVGNSGKRVLEGADIPVPEKKRPKFSPPKNNAIPKTQKQNQSTALSQQKSNDFVFAKPQLPIKKTTITKQQKPVKSMQVKVPCLPKEKPVKPTEEKNTSKVVDLPVEKVISSSQKTVEKLISKSSEPVTAIRENNFQKMSENISPAKESLPTDTTLQSTTDMSMRPSFIKRKLFTQKVDVAEKNSSSDSVQADSPQTNVYSKIQREKNRARKLVTSQSCLNRDVGDDSNLLDLIYKIVPADRMNVTTAAKTETQNNKRKPANADKFDVTSLITTCNNTDDDVSDTFTDEEIFAGDDSQKQQTENINKSKTVEKQLQSKQTVQNSIETKKKTANGVKNITDGVPVITQCNNNLLTQVQKAVISPQCKVVMEKASYIHKEAANTVMAPISPTERSGLMKATVCKGVKSFWDSDTESDLETTLLKKIHTEHTALPTEKFAEDPVKTVTAPLIQANVTSTNKKSQNKTKSTVEVKTVVNQNLNSTTLNKKKNNLAKKPKNINKSPENNNLESISVQNELAKTKSKPTGKISNSKKISVSKKENYPPADVPKTAKNKFSASLKLQNDGVSQNLMKKTASKAKITLNNNNSTLSNDESQHNKIHNSTIRIRAQRKPKVIGCCGEQDKLHESVNKTNTSVLCRSLRSRDVDLSTSLKSDDDNVTVAKKTATKNKRPAKPNKISKIIKEKTLPSDVSFTLATDVSPSNRTLKNKKASAHYKQHKLRQSDVSFTLTSENKSLNDTVSTRTSRKNREVESLLNNSTSFLKSGKPSRPCRNLAAESQAINKSNNLRLNRSRRLL